MERCYLARILIVDDERLLVKGLKRSLENDGYDVEVAYDGEQALSMANQQPVDLIVLDIMLPKVDGLEVCRRLRQVSSVPIIMLTAKGDDVDKIVGLELGADDYMAKPFNTRELIARIRAILRRSTPASAKETESPSDEVINTGGLKIEVQRQRVTIDEQVIDLTSREFELLLTMARHPGRIFTREVLLEKVWGPRYFGEPRVVDVYVRRLRQKVEPDPTNPRWIATRWGTGYYFQEHK